MVVQNALSNAKYDRTIQATILKCTDSVHGIYTAKYQDAKFTAYASNVNDTYPNGSLVYVLVPENNMASHKTILGTVKNLGTDYSSIVLDSQRFFEIGSDIITLHQPVSLNSYQCIDNIPERYKNLSLIIGTKIDENNEVQYITENCHGIALYDADDEDLQIQNIIDESSNEVIYVQVVKDAEILLTIDVAQLKLLYKNNSSFINSLKMGGLFRTELPEEQQFVPADYGIYIEVEGLFNETQTQKRFLTIGTNSMIGNPYQLLADTEQINYKDIDNFKITQVDKVYFFGRNFPYREDISDIDTKPDDIFLSKIYFSLCHQASEEEISSLNLQVRLPQGTYFKTDESELSTRLLDAIVRKGTRDYTESDQTDYYWFEENAKVNFRSGYSAGYDVVGGDGWKCLNSLDTTQGSHTPAPSKYHVKKRDVQFEEKRYMCVAIYDGVKLKKQVTLYNYDAIYKIVLNSSRGRSFSTLDSGTTQISAKLYRRDNLNWIEVPATDYSIDWYTQDQYDNYQLRASDVTYVTIGLSEFSTNYAVNCAVTLSDGKGTTGTARIELYKTAGEYGRYSLTIENKNPLFLYDTVGISPTHQQNLERQIEVVPLTYYIYDNETGGKIEGKDLPADYAFWEFPNAEESLIVRDTETEYNSEVTFNIADKYDPARNANNIISLTVNYDGEKLISTTEILFSKQGDNGTNGTSFAAKIIPNLDYFENQYFPVAPLNSNKEGFVPDTWSHLFDVDLYYNGVLIFEGNLTGLPNRNTQILTGQSEVKVTWEFIKSSNQDLCTFDVDNETGLFSVLEWNSLFEDEPNVYPSPHLVNILQVTVKYNKLSCIATLPIATVIGQNSNEVYIKENTGLRYVVYKEDKTSPSYSSNPFFQIMNADGEIPINTWAAIGESYYNKDWHISQEIEIAEDENGNTVLIPAKEYNGYTLSNAVVGYSDDIVIHIPIHFMLNRYANSAINAWDGNKIVLDDENGAILAPQVIAGVKENDNSFTGVFMGTARHMSENDEIGLMAYNHGRRSFFLDSYTGMSIFGIESIGAIKIEPGKDPVIQSGNFREPKNGVAGEGLSIGFGANPYITFGSKKFYVKPDGSMYAEGATINGSFEVYNKDGENQSHIFLNEKESTIHLYDYANDAEIGRYVRGETLISPKKFLIAGYDPEDYTEPLPQSYKDYNLPDPINSLKYEKGTLKLNGEFECKTESSDIAFKNSPTATHIAFWNTKIENEEGAEGRESGYIKNTSEWTTSHLYLYNYGAGIDVDGYAPYDIDAETAPTPKGYFKYNSNGLAMKGTFSAETKVSRVRFSDKPMQNYIKFVDLDEADGETIIKGESEWSPRRFCLKTYGEGGKRITGSAMREEQLSELYDAYLAGEISEADYKQAEQAYMAIPESDIEDDNIISSLTYMNGILRYTGGITLSAPPFAKLAIDPNDGRNSYLQFRDFIDPDNSSSWIADTKIAPGEFSVKARTFALDGTVDTSELTMRNGKLRLKGELDMETPVVKVRFTKDTPQGSYISFTNLDEDEKTIGKQRMSPDMFRLATYDEDGKIDASFKFKDGKINYRGDMEITTDKGIFEMSQDKMLIRMGDVDEETGRKKTDFRLTPSGFSFRAFGPKEELEAQTLPKARTKVVNCYTKEDVLATNDKSRNSSFLCYQDVNVYLADAIPEDGLSIEDVEKLDKLFESKSAQQERKERLDDLKITYGADGHIILDSDGFDTYTEYHFEDNGETEEKIEDVITEEYKDVTPEFLLEEKQENDSWVETSALVYDSEYGKLRLNGNLSIRNSHGTIVLNEDMMRIMFKSWADLNGTKVPNSRMCISEDSFYFYSFGNIQTTKWEYGKDPTDNTRWTYRVEKETTEEWGVTGGIYYSDGVLRIIGEVNADYGQIGGWSINPQGLGNMGQNIVIGNNGVISAGGNALSPGIFETRWNDKRSSLIKGRFDMENYSGDDNLDREIFRGVNEAQKKLASHHQNLVINSLGARLGKCLLNSYENKGSMNTVFNFPLSAFAFLSDTSYESTKIKNENWIKTQADREAQVNPQDTPYTEFMNEYEQYKSELSGIKDRILKRQDTADPDLWERVGSIYSEEKINAGINIMARGLSKEGLIFADDFEDCISGERDGIKVIDKNSENKTDADAADSGVNTYFKDGAANSIFFGVQSNIDDYDEHEREYEEALREGLEDAPDDETAGGGFFGTITGQVAVIRAFNLQQDNNELIEYYRKNIENHDGYEFTPFKNTGRLSMIIGRCAKGTASAGNDEWTEEYKDSIEKKSAYVYGTEIYPHLVKTKDIYMHNENLRKSNKDKGFIQYGSSSLEGILTELHTVPTNIEYEEDPDNPAIATITETYDTTNITYDYQFKETKTEISSFERVWTITLKEEEGIEGDDREVESISLATEDGKTITINLEGFVCSIGG